MTVLLIIFFVVIVIFSLFKLSLRPPHFPPGNTGYITYENLTIFCAVARIYAFNVQKGTVL